MLIPAHTQSALSLCFLNMAGGARAGAFGRSECSQWGVVGLLGHCPASSAVRSQLDAPLPGFPLCPLTPASCGCLPPEGLLCSPALNSASVLRETRSTWSSSGTREKKGTPRWPTARWGDGALTPPASISLNKCTAHAVQPGQALSERLAAEDRTGHRLCPALQLPAPSLPLRGRWVDVVPGGGRDARKG